MSFPIRTTSFWGSGPPISSTCFALVTLTGPSTISMYGDARGLINSQQASMFGWRRFSRMWASSVIACQSRPSADARDRSTILTRRKVARPVLPSCCILYTEPTGRISIKLCLLISTSVALSSSESPHSSANCHPDCALCNLAPLVDRTSVLMSDCQVATVLPGGAVGGSRSHATACSKKPGSLKFARKSAAITAKPSILSP
mmetsp:Transcript_111470/g.280387  ORF Transcript_111470/g.280387 Transcript_111470/m.280387 type:complete len:202 (+) Transcript_111470:798-1403(+)